MLKFLPERVKIYKYQEQCYQTDFSSDFFWLSTRLNALEIIPKAFSLLYPRAFIVVINSLDSPDNILTNNALYPRGTSVGKISMV